MYMNSVTSERKYCKLKSVQSSLYFKVCDAFFFTSIPKEVTLHKLLKPIKTEFTTRNWS